ncbi:MAG: hypothetical protein KBG04_01095 [Bacteroidales bacterium]|jgi:hypothetical protein|nr:hypothetical protein [Bacteroidales bacterium]
MKGCKNIFALIISFNILSLVTLSAQVSASANASAVIMEAVSISPQAVTELAMDNSLLIKGDKAEVELGSVIIDSGNSGSCSILIKPATVTSKSGDNFMITPKTNDLVANKTLSLKGNTSNAESQLSGFYKGSYTIVFAYN